MCSLHQYLYQVFEDDEDTIEAIEEFVNDITINRYDNHKLLVLQGPGNNGKTTLINKIRFTFNPNEYTVVPAINTIVQMRTAVYNLNGKKFVIVPGNILTNDQISELLRYTNVIVETNVADQIYVPNNSYLTVNMTHVFTKDEINAWKILENNQ